ncbi:hypothetical protein ACFSTC_61400 [Nonomuraea ferruginea]
MLLSRRRARRGHPAPLRTALADVGIAARHGALDLDDPHPGNRPGGRQPDPVRRPRRGGPIAVGDGVRAGRRQPAGVRRARRAAPGAHRQDGLAGPRGGRRGGPPRCSWRPCSTSCGSAGSRPWTTC